MKFLDKINRRVNELLTGTRLPEASAPSVTPEEEAAPSTEATTPTDATETPRTRYNGPWPLDATLLRFDTFDQQKRPAKIPFSLANSYEGTFCFGGIGSGKTSGSGRAFAAAFLRRGFGGLVLCVKGDEAETWVRYARENGREDDLIVFNEANKSSFNFLDYELQRVKGNAAEAVTAVLMELVGANKGGGGDNKIWEQSARRLIRSCFSLCKLSGETPSIELIYRIANSTKLAKELLEKAAVRGEAGELSLSELDDYRGLITFFGIEWHKKADETKGSILMQMTGVCDPFLSGVIRDMFTRSTTVSPDDIFAGKIVVVDLPTLHYYEAGRVSQIAWKYVFERAVQRRTVDDNTRPVFIYADECHAIVTDEDGEFVKTARSHRCATVLLTQNRPNLLVLASKERVDSMLGCFQTKIWHHQADPETRNWSSDVVEKDYQMRASNNVNYQTGADAGKGASGGTSYQQQLEHQLLPVQFLKLAKGGDGEFKRIVTAFLFQSGHEFKTSGKSFALIGFRQGVPVPE